MNDPQATPASTSQAPPQAVKPPHIIQIAPPMAINKVTNEGGVEYPIGLWGLDAEGSVWALCSVEGRLCWVQVAKSR